MDRFLRSNTKIVGSIVVRFSSSKNLQVWKKMSRFRMRSYPASNLNLRCCWRLSNDEESRLFKRSPFDISTCFDSSSSTSTIFQFSVYIYTDKHQHESTLKIMFKHVVLNTATQCAFNVVFLMQSCMPGYRIFWTHTFYMHAYMHGYMHRVIGKPSQLHHV